MFYSGQNVIFNRTLFHASPVSRLSVIEPRTTNSYKDLGKVVFGSSVPQFSACFGSSWSQEYVQIGVMHKDNTDYPNEKRIDKIVFKILDDSKVNLKSPCSMYEIKGVFRYLEYLGGLEMISFQKCQVVKEFKFSTFEEMLNYYNVQIVK